MTTFAHPVMLEDADLDHVTGGIGNVTGSISTTTFNQGGVQQNSATNVNQTANGNGSGVNYGESVAIASFDNS